MTGGASATHTLRSFVVMSGLVVFGRLTMVTSGVRCVNSLPIESLAGPPQCLTLRNAARVCL